MGNNQFARMLKYYLMLNKKTQGDLAKDLGYEKSTVSNWCAGIRVPKLDVIIDIADYLHVNVGDLIEDNRNKDYSVQTDDGKSFIIELMQEPSFNKFIRSYECYKTLNKDGQEKVAEYISDLASSVKYNSSVRLVQSESAELDFLSPVAAHHSSYKEISEEDSKYDLDLLKVDDL